MHMRAMVTPFNAQRQAAGQEPIGIGIATGGMIVGYPVMRRHARKAKVKPAGRTALMDAAPLVAGV
jgi:hypothetical protein